LQLQVGQSEEETKKKDRRKIKTGFQFKIPDKHITCMKLTTIVVEPVIANTVQMRRISLYHAAVPRSGIGLGAVNRCHKVSPFLPVEKSLALFLEP
jgi:hypothetical protein